MKEAEFRDAWLEYELFCFIMPYCFLYGEKWINEKNNAAWLRWQFEREWKRKSEKEKEARLLKFIEAIKQIRAEEKEIEGG